MWTLIGLIGIILAGFGGEFAWMGINVPEGTDPDVMFLGIGAVALIIGLVMTFKGFQTLLMTQRTKKG